MPIELEVARRAASQARARPERAPTKAEGQPNGDAARSALFDTAFSDQELIAHELPEPTFVIPGLIPEGLTVIAGRPKLGKTFLGMNLADATARDGYALGSIKIETPGAVLYLALEDTRRRLRKRRKMMIDGQRLEAAARLEWRTEWPRLDDGGLDKLESWCASTPDARLIVVDTWTKVKPGRSKNEDPYQAEYNAAALLQRLAAKHHVAIVIIHHTRKGERADDFIDEVLGSTGLTGCADTIAVMRRARGEADAELAVTGRDIADEQEKALSFDKTCGFWSLMGSAEEYRRSQERREIIGILQQNGPMKIKLLAEELGKNYPAVQKTCRRMANAGELQQLADGRYAVATHT